MAIFRKLQHKCGKQDCDQGEAMLLKEEGSASTYESLWMYYHPMNHEAKVNAWLKIFVQMHETLPFAASKASLIRCTVLEKRRVGYCAGSDSQGMRSATVLTF